VAFKVFIDKARCKGCGLCVSVCRRLALKMSSTFNARGHHYAEAQDGKPCSGCKQCVDMCPDAAIEIRAVDDTDSPPPQENGD
jgi:2-oxoglutarate ferredoxin oxidoreductase subunit delta